MDTKSREAVEAFIKEAMGRASPGPRQDPETARARAEAAREDGELARGELLAAGLDLKRLDALAADRSKARRERAEHTHRSVI